MTKKESIALERFMRALVLNLGDACNDLETIIHHQSNFTPEGLVEIAKHADGLMRDAMQILGAPDSEQAIVQTVRAAMGRFHRANGIQAGSVDWHAPQFGHLRRS